MSVWEVLWRYGWMCALLLNGLALWVSWSFSKHFVTHVFFTAYSKGVDERIKQMEQRQSEQEGLQRQIMAKLSDLPTATDLHRLEVSLTAIDGAVKTSNADVRGLAHAVGRIERVVDMFTESHMVGAGGRS